MSKISALPAATALDGTESVPVVQAGETRKTPTSSLITWTFFKEETFADGVGPHTIAIPAGITRFKMEFEFATGASSWGVVRFNGDSAANYSWARADNGLNNTSASSSGVPLTYPAQNAASRNRHVLDVLKIASKQASFIGRGQYSSPLGNFSISGEWNNIVDTITSVSLVSGNTELLTAPRVAVWGR